MKMTRVPSRKTLDRKIRKYFHIENLKTAFYCLPPPLSLTQAADCKSKQAQLNGPGHNLATVGSTGVGDAAAAPLPAQHRSLAVSKPNREIRGTGRKNWTRRAKLSRSPARPCTRAPRGILNCRRRHAVWHSGSGRDEAKRSPLP